MTEHVPLTAEEARLRPLDLAPLRAAAAEPLDDGAPLPRFDDLAELTSRLRGHLQVLIPPVEDAARAFPEYDGGRVRALLSVQSARVRLGSSPGAGLVSAREHARGLARELASLCDHYETLTGASTVERA
ncbi:DUF6415 family natural product biosynthesis protein [Streptomyces sp. TS71-3]|uniref:DUF6415 family natural product biosynthesis protein n=1 Tax=Streptomyces sp. TS71-3 TaxID=2733862 RepID=UPI001B024A3A|nr:DUF6415 family natural product biosynthesis protein [Streptomyces sp. TS71-3]GHJ40514.1 hypothetical protein Sm713_61230 [Streptomyces sp. TS71-3]